MTEYRTVCEDAGHEIMPANAPTADLLHSSLRADCEDTADDKKVQADAHEGRSQQMQNGCTDVDNVGKHENYVSQGIDGLATACKSPLHEHSVHDAAVRSP